MGKALIFKAKGQEISVNLVNKGALLAAVEKRFAAQEGFALATINLDHLVKLRCSEHFSRDYAAQDFVVADGNPIVWLSKLAKRPVELVPGSDMVLPLAKLAADRNVKIALFGSTEDSLAASAAMLKAKVPTLDVATCIAPPMGFDPIGPDARSMLTDLVASGAGLIFLALGAPKQEAFAALGRELTPSLGFASIGAGLDFVSGAQTRAPKWVRALAMEWAWRMLKSPARLLPRYLQCFRVLPSLIAEAWALRADKR